MVLNSLRDFFVRNIMIVGQTLQCMTSHLLSWNWVRGIYTAEVESKIYLPLTDYDVLNLYRIAKKITLKQMWRKVTNQLATREFKAVTMWLIMPTHCHISHQTRSWCDPFLTIHLLEMPVWSYGPFCNHLTKNQTQSVFWFWYAHTNWYMWQ